MQRARKCAHSPGLLAPYPMTLATAHVFVTVSKGSPHDCPTDGPATVAMLGSPADGRQHCLRATGAWCGTGGRVLTSCWLGYRGMRRPLYQFSSSSMTTTTNRIGTVPTRKPKDGTVIPTINRTKAAAATTHATVFTTYRLRSLRALVGHASPVCSEFRNAPRTQRTLKPRPGKYPVHPGVLMAKAGRYKRVKNRLKPSRVNNTGLSGQMRHVA